MRNLKLEEVQEIKGGNGESAPTNADTVRENARTAVDVCGAGNVASVSVEGFTCKEN